MKAVGKTIAGATTIAFCGYGIVLDWGSDDGDHLAPVAPLQVAAASATDTGTVVTINRPHDPVDTITGQEIAIPPLQQSGLEQSDT